MNRDIFDRWLAALKACDSPYTGDCFRSGEAWSPRGVLAHVLDPEGWVQDRRHGFWRWHGLTCCFPAWSLAQAGVTAAEDMQIGWLTSQFSAWAGFLKAIRTHRKLTTDTPTVIEPPVPLVKKRKPRTVKPTPEGPLFKRKK